ncbi:hypothetical protein [Pseudomonas petrae]|uniref:hypothetical protein n=1 Tax=Pseudomonas petrae TaxID=2912190 RepID=UPI001F20C5DB|nr:hypothetical protein [Pseudomonas petrae]MCF7539807.1 hypothetical protein [Pseudomonas petrae]
MSYDFNAETTGVIIGRRQGYQKGRNEGYDAGFEDANSQWLEVNNKWKAGYAQLKKENEQQAKTIKEANFAMSSLAIIAMSTMHGLSTANNKEINKVVLRYCELSKSWLDGGYIRTAPAQEPVLIQLSPHICEVMQGWCDRIIEAHRREKLHIPHRAPSE